MPKNSTKFILVNIGRQQWALPLVDSSDFFRLKNIVPIPDVDQNILGLTYHQGHIVVVLAVDKILGLALNPQDQQCVRVDYIGDHYGLIVNKAGQIIAAQRILTDKKKKFCQQYILINNKKVFVLNIQDLLNQIISHGQT